MQSQRTDGRGHWPAGKSKHAQPARGRALRECQALLRRLTRQELLRATARALNCSDRTLRRWRDGDKRPSAQAGERLRIVAGAADSAAHARTGVLQDVTSGGRRKRT
jgi:DNA-binding transcriptional regulator YiaG